MKPFRLMPPVTGAAFALTLTVTALDPTAANQLLANGPPLAEPVVARVEMKLAVDEKVVDVIAKGDLLTVLEELEDSYVIVTHDGSRGAVDKVNAVRIAESGEIYTDLIELNPNEGRYYTLRASSWWALGNAERALDDFDRAIELGYTEGHAYTSRGLFHAEMGNYELAIEDYNQALKIDPDDISAKMNRAAAYMSQGQYIRAVWDYTDLLEERKDSVSLLQQRAIAYKAAGRLEESAQDFDAILELRPDDYAAIMGRGYVHFQRKDYDAAIKDFTRAIELNPENAIAWNNRGYNRHQVKAYDDALSDYNEAVRLAPNYALAYQNRAWLLATAEDDAMRDPTAAVDSAKKACELSNYESVADLSALAAALAAAEKFDEAVGWQEKVVEALEPPFLDFAEKTLKRYQDERPFAADPDKANAEEKAAAEREAEEERQRKKLAQQRERELLDDAEMPDAETLDAETLAVNDLDEPVEADADTQ